MKILLLSSLQGSGATVAIFLFIILFLILFPSITFAQETDYTYTNQEQDKSGLMHYDSRYYDPDLGRFLQPDSFDVPNKYAYVSNNPVNRIDPSGHIDFSTSFSDKIIGCAISICNGIENAYVSANNSFDNWISGGNGSDLEAVQKLALSNHRLSYEDAMSIALPTFLGKGMLGIPKAAANRLSYESMGRLAARETNKTILKIKGSMFQYPEYFVSNLPLTRTFLGEIPDNLRTYIFEAPLNKIFPFHDVKSQIIHGKGEQYVENLVVNFLTTKSYNVPPIVLSPRGDMFLIYEGVHRAAAMGILEQETIPAVLETNFSYIKSYIQK